MIQSISPFFLLILACAIIIVFYFNIRDIFGASKFNHTALDTVLSRFQNRVRADIDDSLQRTKRDLSTKKHSRDDESTGKLLNSDSSALQLHTSHEQVDGDNASDRVFHKDCGNAEHKEIVTLKSIADELSSRLDDVKTQLLDPNKEVWKNLSNTVREGVQSQRNFTINELSKMQKTFFNELNKIESSIDSQGKRLANLNTTEIQRAIDALDLLSHATSERHVEIAAILTKNHSHILDYNNEQTENLQKIMSNVFEEDLTKHNDRLFEHLNRSLTNNNDIIAKHLTDTIGKMTNNVSSDVEVYVKSNGDLITDMNGKLNSIALTSTSALSLLKDDAFFKNLAERMIKLNVTEIYEPLNKTIKDLPKDLDVNFTPLLGELKKRNEELQNRLIERIDDSVKQPIIEELREPMSKRIQRETENLSKAIIDPIIGNLRDHSTIDRISDNVVERLRKSVWSDSALIHDKIIKPLDTSMQNNVTKPLVRELDGPMLKRLKSSVTDALMRELNEPMSKRIKTAIISVNENLITQAQTQAQQLERIVKRLDELPKYKTQPNITSGEESRAFFTNNK